MILWALNEAQMVHWVHTWRSTILQSDAEMFVYNRSNVSDGFGDWSDLIQPNYMNKTEYRDCQGATDGSCVFHPLLIDLIYNACVA